MATVQCILALLTLGLLYSVTARPVATDNAKEAFFRIISNGPPQAKEQLRSFFDRSGYMQSGVFPFGEKQGGRYSMPQQQGWTTTNYRKEQDAQQQGNEYPFSKEQGARFPFGKEQGYQRQWPQWSLPFAEEEGVKLQLAQQPNWIASLFSKGQGYQRQWSKEQGKRVPFAKEEGIKLQPPQQQNWIIRTPFSEEQGKKLKQYADEQGTSSPFDWLLPSAYNKLSEELSLLTDEK